MGSGSAAWLLQKGKQTHPVPDPPASGGSDARRGSALKGTNILPPRSQATLKALMQGFRRRVNECISFIPLCSLGFHFNEKKNEIMVYDHNLNVLS